MSHFGSELKTITGNAAPEKFDSIDDALTTLISESKLTPIADATPILSAAPVAP